MAVSSIVIRVFASMLLICGCFSEKDDTLQMVQILYRHGDRSPVIDFPTNPLPESAWPQGYGQLTNVGMLQHFELGKYFRKRYIEGEPYRLLNSSYNRHEVILRSTDFDRTLMSAYSNLAGLYPPSGDQIWNKELLWQPIPVHTIPVDVDYLLYPGFSCPQYSEYVRQVFTSDEVKKEEHDNKEFYQLLTSKTGMEIGNISEAYIVFDPIYCARTHGLLEPSWANLTWKGRTVFDKLHEIFDLYVDLVFNRLGEGRLTGGMLLKEMIENMQSQIYSKKSEVKSYIYSAHDSTVAALLSALKLYNRIAPPYTSAVLLELHKIEGQHMIRLLYKNDSTQDGYSLQIPGCGDSCLFEDFIRLTEDNIPVDWYLECQLESASTFDLLADKLILLSIAIILLSSLLVATLIYVVRRKRKRYNGYVAYDAMG